MDIPERRSTPVTTETTAGAREVNVAKVAEVAEAIVSVWRESEGALCPIIGRGGVDALYRRSLLLTARSHPWLVEAKGAGPAITDLDLLKVVLVRQGSADATAGGSALLHNFRELLASVIGESLTDRLLRSTWADAVSQHQAREPSP